MAIRGAMTRQRLEGDAMTLETTRPHASDIQDPFDGLDPLGIDDGTLHQIVVQTGRDLRRCAPTLSYPHALMLSPSHADHIQQPPGLAASEATEP